MSENYFLSRRSCREFSSEKISDKEIKNIITKAVKAPTCGNMQLYSVIVSKESENIEKLSEWHYNQPAAKNAPVILTVCADFNRFTRWCEQNNANAGYDNFHSFITAATDALIFTQQIVTIAESEGYGTCYLGTVIYNAKEISDFLELPDLIVPIASISLGKPIKSGEKTERLPIEAVLHFEKYHDADPQEIEEFFKVHDEDPSNQKFIKENNKENLAQVFAEVRYPEDVNLKLSEEYLQLLKEKKFFK